MPSATRFSVPALVALSLLGAPARAQDVLQGSSTDRVDSGAVLRVTKRDGAVVKGTLVNWNAAGVTLAGREGNGTSPSLFRLTDLKAVEVRSVSRRTWEGVLAGLATGVAVGIAGAVYGCIQQGGKENFCPLGFMFAPPFFGAIGAVAGAGVGTMMHSESWQPVQLAPQ
ncbi:MAG: hypothetical protein ABJA80_10260 [bacterium]